MIFITLNGFVSAQENTKSESQEHRYSISLKNILLWSNGINFTANISQQINLETTISIALAYGAEAGVNYFIFEDEKKYNPYTGLHAGWMTMTFLTRSDYLAIMIPLGMEFYRKRWVLGIETGYMFMKESSYHKGDFSPYRHENHHLPYYAAKVGFRFPSKK